MGKEAKKWMRLFPFLLLPAWLVTANCVADPGNVFHDVSKDVADSILAGNRTFVASGNLDEHGTKYNIITSMSDDIDAVAVGPSLAMCIGEEIVGTDSYYNLGHSGAHFYDIMAQFGAMDAYGKHPKKVVFCVDTYFFDEIMYEKGYKYYAMRPYAAYMQDILDGKEAQIPETGWAEKLKTRFKTKFEQLFSISYFQASVQYMKANNSLYVKRIGIADENTQRAYYMPDGSWIYAYDVREKDVDYVIQHALEYDLEKQFSKGEHISESSKRTFDRLLGYLEEQGTEVELFLCPLAPSLWDRVNPEEYPLLPEIEQYANEMAEKYDLKVTGSYNPYVVGISDDQFYDSRHVRREALGEYFDFSEDGK